MTPESDQSSPSTSSSDNGPLTDMAEHQDSIEGNHSKMQSGSNGASSTPANAKDPQRPRRKKARRACLACQRAHLTCGDERPCQRCVKRGLSSSCHDGMRKKAKYLHDAPNEALMPGLENSNGNGNGTDSNGPGNGNGNGHGHGSGNRNGHFDRHGIRAAPPTLPSNVASPKTPSGMANQRGLYAVTEPVSPSMYEIYPPGQLRTQIPTPMQDFGNQQTSPPLHSATSQQSTPVQGLGVSMAQSSPATQVPRQTSFSGHVFDSNDPAVFGFDLSTLNFGNHYGALEFGMLGHMSGAADATPGENGGSMGPGTGFGSSDPVSSGYTPSPSAPTFAFGPDALQNNWTRHGSAGNIYQSNDANMAHARRNPSFAPGYTIGTGLNGLVTSSPTSGTHGAVVGFNGPAFVPNFYHPGPLQAQTNIENQMQERDAARTSFSSSTVQHHMLGLERDPSTIYNSVKQPYSYTTGFHGLTAFLQRRFPPQKTLRIAKALASIRPSFISCTKTLKRDDLIFMEQCFQRTLCEYEKFIGSYGTPTIVCRRTGEIAAVNEEFTLLTGWQRGVLLGYEPNLNDNAGGVSGDSSTGNSSKGGSNTPRVPDGQKMEGIETLTRPQPVFLAELLDDDSVIQFYEDFAKLAFGDSRGSIMTTGKLLKYRPRGELALSTNGEHDEPMVEAPKSGTDDTSNGRRGSKESTTNDSDAAATTKPEEPAEQADARKVSINKLELESGKVECSYCWTVKRDVFDIPMLIVMNFLPCI